MFHSRRPIAYTSNILNISDSGRRKRVAEMADSSYYAKTKQVKVKNFFFGNLAV
jgi:hypothetical protein